MVSCFENIFAQKCVLGPNSRVYCVHFKVTSGAKRKRDTINSTLGLPQQLSRPRHLLPRTSQSRLGYQEQSGSQLNRNLKNKQCRLFCCLFFIPSCLLGFPTQLDIIRRYQGLFRPQIPCTLSIHCPIANSASIQSQQPV